MHFLKTLFWVLVAVLAILFASRNWAPVTLNLWSDIQADVKLPLLLLFMFLIGFLPTWLVLRARVWSLKRRVEALERNRASTLAAGQGRNEEEPAA
jgi:putative membrane protein